MSLKVMLNGQERVLDTLGEGSELLQTIAALGLKADRVAVELNGEIVRRNAWSVTPLNNGDKLEVVHFVGGGSGRS